MKKYLALLLAALMLTALLPLAAFAESTGTVLKYGTDAEPTSFDPHNTPGVASLRILSQVYNTLIDVNDNLEVVPELATNWEQPDDITYIFHLRENVTFHNGRKMTAEDVKYSFERILSDKSMLGNTASYAANVDKVEVVDENTVKITMKAVTAAFLPSLSSTYCSIVAKEVVEANGADGLKFVDGGTGPYTLGTWVPDNSVTIHKYDGYFLEDTPKIDQIEYYVMTDSAARLAALRTGGVQLIYADTSMLPLVANDASIKTLSFQTRNYVTLCLNTTLDYFKDVRVRQAISLAVDRQEIIDLAMNGHAVISGFAPASMGHWAVDVTTNPMYQRNIEKAKQLMAEAGYPNGFEVTLTVGLLDQLRDTGAVVQQQLAEIGIKVNVVNKENAEYIDLWSKHEFEMMACHNGAGFDPSRAVAFFFKTANTANIAGYSNARVDELCDLGAGTTDVDARRGYYQEAINIILDECPNVVIYSPSEFFMSSANLEGFVPSASHPYDLSGAYFK